jgi:hypothetical protein
MMRRRVAIMMAAGAMAIAVPPATAAAVIAAATGSGIIAAARRLRARTAEQAGRCPAAPAPAFDPYSLPDAHLMKGASSRVGSAPRSGNRTRTFGR